MDQIDPMMELLHSRTTLTLSNPLLDPPSKFHLFAQKSTANQLCSHLILQLVLFAASAEDNVP